MSENDKVFSGSIPENYDRHMVPLIFASYARDIVATRRRACAKSRTGDGGRQRRCDACAGADAFARRQLRRDRPQPADARLCATRQEPRTTASAGSKADAQALPFEDAAFDLVCCQFGVMFFPDRPSGYREARRVLKPGGYFLFSAWDRIEENVFADDVTNALAEFFPNDPPRFMARTPHGYHDTALIRSDLAKAGFSNVTIETRAEQSRAPSPRHVAVAYCQGTPLRNEIEARGAESSRRRPTMPPPRSRASTAAARWPPRSRRTSFWRGPRTRPAAPAATLPADQYSQAR